MRKEVKLGMAIGGGVVAILIVYLLVAPPSHAKKGAQLAGAGGNANGNLLDPTNTGDVAPQPPANLNVSEPVGGDANHADKPVESAAQKPAADTPPKPANGASRDQWTSTLEKGKQPAEQAPKPGPHQKATDTAKGEPEATKLTDARPTHPGPVVHESHVAAPPQQPMYFDPKAAWGGGVSTDAKAMGSARMQSEGSLISDKPRVSGKSEAPAVRHGANTHVVKSGETFSSIALEAYGSSAYYPHILRANPTLNPNALRPGITINLPPASEVKAGPAEKVSEPAGAKMVEDVKIDPGRQYKVVAGDSLYKIGQKLYGKGTMGDRIYELNKQTIGADPRRLKLGMILQLPEPPPGAPSGATGTPSGSAKEGTTVSKPASLDEAWNGASSASEPFFGNESDPK